MTALAANKNVVEKRGNIVAHPMAVDIVFKGALLKHNAAGYLAPCAAEAGAKFAGVAYEYKDNSAGSAGDIDCRTVKKDRVLLEGSGFNQTDVGEKVYATDDQTITKTFGATVQLVGIIDEYVSSTQVWVKIDGYTEANDFVVLDQLDVGIKPSHIVVFAGEFTTLGGDTAEAIAAVGALATDLVHVTMHTVGAAPVTILTASADTDVINIVTSADPSTDHVFTYSVLRAAA